MTTAVHFLARQLPAEHPYLATVHDSMTSGACAVEPPAGAIPCDQLLTIHRQRAVHLARSIAQHARDLREDVLRFCERLTTSRGATALWWVFRLPEAVRYEFVEHSGTNQLLGALRTVSKLEVPAEEWDRLWND